MGILLWGSRPKVVPRKEIAGRQAFPAKARAVSSGGLRLLQDESCSEEPDGAYYDSPTLRCIQYEQSPVQPISKSTSLGWLEGG